MNIAFRELAGHYEYLATGSTFCITIDAKVVTAAWLAQLGERRSAEREVAGSNPGRTSTQGL